MDKEKDRVPSQLSLAEVRAKARRIAFAKAKPPFTSWALIASFWLCMTALFVMLVHNVGDCQEIYVMLYKHFTTAGPIPPPTVYYADGSVASGSDTVSVIFFRNGGNNTHTEENPSPKVVMNVRVGDSAAELAKEVAPLLGYAGRSVGVYNCTGLEISTFAGARDNDLFYIVPRGEHWFWPGVYVGYRTTLYGVGSPNAHPLVLETVSLVPRAFTIENFLSDDEAGAVIDAALPFMEKSGVYGGVQQLTKMSDVRTSQQAWLVDHDPIAIALDERVSQLTRVNVGVYGERIQVVHYNVGQHYHAHHDYFDPRMYPDRDDLQAGRNRMITVLFYLNDVPKGGATAFPRGGETGYGEEAIRDYGDCSRGVIVKPQKNKALMFYSLQADGHMDGNLDTWSLHGGCDVLEGEKWASNKWIYNRRE